MHDKVFDESEIAATRRPVEVARWLPERAYTDPAVWDAEVSSVLKDNWIALFHGSVLPNPGDYRAIDVVGRPLLVVRGADSQLRAFLNICRHRGMALAQGTGHCGTFICPYHTWCYDLDGSLAHAPLMSKDQTKDIDGLVPVRLDTFLGFVFVNFDDDAAPLAERTAAFAGDLEAWDAENLAIVYEEDFDCPWNWKITVENGIEGYHLIGTHRNSANSLLPANLAYVSSGDGFSILHMPYGEREQGEGYPGSMPTLPNLPAWAEEEHRYYLLWPNFSVSCGPDALYAYVRVPYKQDSHTTTWTMLTAPNALNLDDYKDRAEKQTNFARLIFSEDAYACSTVARNLGSGSWIPGPYQKAEVACWDFHQWYLDRVQRLAGT